MSNSHLYTNLSFFDRLRTGVSDIENKVKQLKQLQEKGFDSSSPLESSVTDEDIQSVKLFDRDVRNTYVEVSTLYNTVKGCPINLNCVQNDIQRMKQMLTDIESNSSLIEFGYKPWVPPVNLNSTFLVKNETDRAMSDIKQNLDSLSLTQSIPTEKQESINDDQQQQCAQRTAFIDSKQINKPKPIQNKLLENMCRTPQRYDFGISNRHTLLPEEFLNLNKYNELSEEIPCYDTSVTSRFSCFTSSMNIEFPTNNINYNLGSNNNNITPPNMSSTTASNATDSFVTVEFTPGLTTKRPKNISRVKSRFDDCFADKNAVKIMPQFSQNEDNEDNITPEQPINNIIIENTVNTVIKTFNKSGTPSKPQTRVNENLHNKLIKKKN